jgi:predicted RNase H-like HicB family nuclease
VSCAAAPAWVSPQPLPARQHWLLIWEIVVVFAVSLGISAVRSLVLLIGSLTVPQALSAQHVVINGSQAPGRPWFDLSLQLVSIASGVAPALLVFYLLAKNGERPSSIGVDASEPWRDLLRGAGLAALIGGCGLGLYILAFKAGISLDIVAASLPDVWWRVPVLLLSALQDGILEEVLVVGYLLSRLRLLMLAERGDGKAAEELLRRLGLDGPLPDTAHLYEARLGVVTRVVHVPYVVEQDEDGVWCASAQLRPGVGAVGDGPTADDAVADLRDALEVLLAEVGPPDELTLTLDVA